jgi:GH15 family glucan-1,4-alpha-glucosidase
VCDNWNREDEGVWEFRGGWRHFVYSRFMSWVAIDRGLRLADKRSFPADRSKWLAARDTIYEKVMDKGWDPKRKVFVQAYGWSACRKATATGPGSISRSRSSPSGSAISFTRTAAPSWNG